ncbi:ras-related protein rab-5c [Anaeramoeba ignava]|uniref:Ras-related protein rab-5c n=1 Tax=Anaeramoeba ignava TaxID=1746090 RepID=A0A9Q0LQ96_ANAIG|nr:ras-related protein rab-5c [Anaeramoeba ignava]
MTFVTPNASKIVILGDSGVGKTSLALRFTHNEFHDLELSTVGAKCFTKSVHVADKDVHFSIWDTAGQERFQSLAPIYYRNSRAAIIVYDITQKKSFHEAERWVDEMKRHGDEDLVIALIGNKSDLNEYREVKMKVAQEYALKNNLIFLETSAKTGEHVEDLFMKIAEMLPSVHAKIPENLDHNFGIVSISKLEEKEKRKEKKNCC